jgi:perosamine synthetase
MSETSISAYSEAVIQNFEFLKSSESIQDLYLRAIPIEDIGFLVPVSKVHLADTALIALLTEWRNKYVSAYPSQFEATNASTEKWLQNNLLPTKDRILFLVTDRAGMVIGHLGFNSCLNANMEFEIDNVIRGVAGVIPGLFSSAMSCLIRWARKTINVEGFFLRVMDDNPHAIDFYKRNSFLEQSKIPLVKESSGSTTNYREVHANEKFDKFFIRMVYQDPEPVAQSMILTAGPSISARESVYAFDAATNGWNNQWSKYLTKFEEKFAEYIGSKYAIATSSCTGALQIALMALDIGPGDEVIVPDQTWVATANAVRYAGAIPIFADVELDTWNIDSASVESLITPRTKAIIAVHMYGHPARMANILAIAEKYGLRVIEDAAPAIGAEWEGQRCGTFGDFAAFSFQGAKLLVTGEGGMLVTNNADLYKRALKIWDQGRNPEKVFWIDGDGVKFKMSNVQAAIGLGQLERSDELIEMKRRVFRWYEEGLADVPFIRLNKEVEHARSIYWMSSIFVDEMAPLGRDDLIKELRALNIDTRPVFPAISQYPIWPHTQSPKKNALRIGNRAMNLPSGVGLRKDEVLYVTRQIRQLLK